MICGKAKGTTHESNRKNVYEQQTAAEILRADRKINRREVQY